MPHRGSVLSQRQDYRPHSNDEEGRLPEMVGERKHVVGNHFDLPFLASFRSSSSASLTSCNVSWPVFTMCAITGLLPKRLSSSSISLPCARFREIAASKILALPILFVKRSAFLASSRDTIVCTVVKAGLSFSGNASCSSRIEHAPRVQSVSIIW